MHNEEWSGTRVAAVLARIGDAGYPQSRLARMTTISQSTLSRWGNGKVRPGYDAVRHVAAAIWRQYPDLARELVEASGYPWQEPSEPEPEPLVAPELAESLRKHAPEDAERIIAELERRRAGRPRPPGAAGDGPGPGTEGDHG